MPSTPDREPALIVAVERALRANGFFILGRHWDESGACAIRFRAMYSPIACFRLDHELLISGDGADADVIAAYIRTHRKEWAPLLEALAN